MPTLDVMVSRHPPWLGISLVSQFDNKFGSNDIAEILLQSRKSKIIVTKVGILFRVFCLNQPETSSNNRNLKFAMKSNETS